MSVFKHVSVFFSHGSDTGIERRVHISLDLSDQ